MPTTGKYFELFTMGQNLTTSRHSDLAFDDMNDPNATDMIFNFNADEMPMMDVDHTSADQGDQTKHRSKPVSKKQKV